MKAAKTLSLLNLFLMHFIVCALPTFMIACLFMNCKLAYVKCKIVASSPLISLDQVNNHFRSI